MPTDFRKVMDLLLAKFREVFVFVDDISIITKGTKNEHLNKMQEILKVMNEAQLQLKAGKCTFAKQENRVARLQDGELEHFVKKF